MNPFLIYLCGIVDNVIVACGITGAVGLLGGIAAMLATFDQDMFDDPEAARLFLKKILAVAVTLALLSMLLPNSKTLAAMVIIPAIAESEVIREDIPQLYDAAIEKLKESLELTPDVEK